MGTTPRDFDPLNGIWDPWIPQAKVEQILPIFGINQPTPLYERRLRPEGLRLSDLAAVLSESRFTLGMDWRGELEYFIRDVIGALVELGVVLSYEPEGDDTDSGTLVSSDGRREFIQYLNAGDDFAPVVEAIRRLIPRQVEFRASPGNPPASDGWNYAVLLEEEWRQVEAIVGPVIRELFAPMPPPSDTPPNRQR